MSEIIYSGCKIEYSIKNDLAVIEKCGVCGERLILPEKIEDKRVAALSRYALSGHRNLREVLLPSGLEKIDNLCFYNDRGLKRLELPKGLFRIGGDAFKNCDGITDVVIGSERILKYVLNELGQELCITLRDGETILWRLIFPIEAESFSEDVPGRAFHRTFTGPGYTYRREAVGRRVDFGRYDGLFRRSTEEETEETLCFLAVCRLLYPTGLSSENREMYRAYLSENAVKGGKSFFDRGFFDELGYMISEELLSRDAAEALLEYVRSKGSAELSARLMDYRIKKFGHKKKIFEL